MPVYPMEYSSLLLCRKGRSSFYESIGIRHLGETDGGGLAD
jgi:hypothetical protein